MLFLGACIASVLVFIGVTARAAVYLHSFCDCSILVRFLDCWRACHINFFQKSYMICFAQAKQSFVMSHHQFVCVCLSVCLSICLFVCLVCVFVCVFFACLSICMYFLYHLTCTGFEKIFKCSANKQIEIKLCLIAGC